MCDRGERVWTSHLFSDRAVLVWIVHNALLRAGRRAARRVELHARSPVRYPESHPARRTDLCLACRAACVARLVARPVIYVGSSTHVEY